MALKKRGEEWEEYDNAVQWMVLTVVISLVLTIVLAIVALPLGYLVGTSDYRGNEQPVSFPIKYSRLGAHCYRKRYLKNATARF